MGIWLLAALTAQVAFPVDLDSCRISDTATLAAASPGYDDRDWPTFDVTAPDSARTHVSTLWLRCTAVLPPNTHLTLRVGGLFAEYDLYVDGRLLLKDERPGRSLIDLPPSTTATRTLAFLTRRSEAQARFSGHPWTAHEWFIAPRTTVERLVEADLNAHAAHHRLRLVLGLLILAVGLYHVWLQRRRRELDGYQWYGWFLVLVSAWQLVGLPQKFGLLEASAAEAFLVAMGLAHLAVGIGVGYGWVFVLGRPMPRTWRLLQVIAAINGVALILFRAEALWILRPPFGEVLSLTIISGLTFLFVWEAVRGNRRARIVVTGMLIMSGVVAYQLLSQARLVPPPPNWLVLFSFLPFLASMGVAVADQYARALQRLDDLAPKPLAPIDPGALAPGTELGRYIIDRKLGEGGMGVVYRATDPKLDRSVAIKLVRPVDGALPGAQAALEQEARAMAKVVHPNLVTVFDVGSYDEEVFIAMELVEGETLAEWLETPRAVAARVAAFVAAGRGLHALHLAGLVHRDVKPQNVFVTAQGRTLLADLGLAQRVHTGEADGVPATLGAGTPRYKAPEQHRQQPATPKTDQFGYCVAAYEAFFGVHPFRVGQDSQRALRRMFRSQFIDPVEDPGRPGLRAVLTRGLRAAPDERWKSMEELVDALELAALSERGR